MFSSTEQSRIAELLGYSNGQPGSFAGFKSLENQVILIGSIPVELARARALLIKIEQEETKLDAFVDFVHITSAQNNLVEFDHKYGVRIKEQRIRRYINRLATILDLTIEQDYFNQVQPYRYL